MIREMRMKVGERVTGLYCSMLGTLVTWFIPDAVRLDENDPILGARGVPTAQRPSDLRDGSTPHPTRAIDPDVTGRISVG